jgi:hypothetical protein
MTRDDWMRVGARLLGIYFIVEAIVALTGIPAVWGMVIPEGISHRTVVVSYLARAGVAGIAGAVLVGWSWGSTTGARTSAPASIDALVEPALQLMGVLLAVDGLTGAVRTGPVLTGTGWHLRASELLTALLTLAIGAWLVMKPSVTGQQLRRWRTGA